MNFPTASLHCSHEWVTSVLWGCYPFLLMRTKVFLIVQTKVPSNLLFYFKGSQEQVIGKTKHIFTLSHWYGKICQEARKTKVFMQAKMQFRENSVCLWKTSWIEIDLALKSEFWKEIALRFTGKRFSSNCA